MSARDELLAIYPLSTLDDANRRIVEHGVDQLLDEHAHELAEKQRDMLRQGFRMEPWASVVNSLGQEEPLGTTHVIDHIDPEITEVRPARVALAELRDGGVGR